MDFRAEAARPLFLDGYAYDGTGAHEVAGDLRVELSSESNGGKIEARVQDAIHQYEIRWKNFAGRLPYQSGGVARDLELWGSTGNGSAVFPRVYVYAAAFGRATVLFDGKPEKDPTSLAADFQAVFFLTQGRYRDLDTFEILSADRSRPYDPAQPDDAFVSAIGAQAVVIAYASNGEPYRFFEYLEPKILRLS